MALKKMIIMQAVQKRKAKARSEAKDEANKKAMFSKPCKQAKGPGILPSWN